MLIYATLDPKENTKITFQNIYTDLYKKNQRVLRESRCGVNSIDICRLLKFDRNRISCRRQHAQDPKTKNHILPFFSYPCSRNKYL